VAEKTENRQLLDDLVAQRDQVLARIAELEAQQDDFDLSDPSGAVSRLKEASLELVALRSVLGVLEVQIVQLRGKLGVAQGPVDQEACVILWEDERGVLDAVVLTTQLLKLQLDDLQKVQRQITDQGGYCRARVPLSLSQAVFGALETWRLHGVWLEQDQRLRRS
jgi:hypothetical protein